MKYFILHIDSKEGVLLNTVKICLFKFKRTKPLIDLWDRGDSSCLAGTLWNPEG